MIVRTFLNEFVEFFRERLGRQRFGYFIQKLDPGGVRDFIGGGRCRGLVHTRIFGHVIRKTKLREHTDNYGTKDRTATANKLQESVIQYSVTRYRRLFMFKVINNNPVAHVGLRDGCL